MKHALIGVLAAVAWGGALPAEQWTTVRAGEQDTCKITGVTTIKNDAGERSAGSTPPPPPPDTAPAP